MESAVAKRTTGTARRRDAESHVERRRGETMAADVVERLAEMIGPTQTARELGVSTTLVHKARKAGIVTKAVGLAAQALYHNLQQGATHVPAKPVVDGAVGAPWREPQQVPASAPALSADYAVVVVKIARSHLNTLRDVATMLGADWKEL